MQAPEFETLLERYMAEWPVPRSDISDDEVAALEQREGITLPPDYAALLQTWDLEAIEVYFTRFSPPFAEKFGVIKALEWGRHAPTAPFAERYLEWQVLSVGEDFAQRQLIMSVGGEEATSAGHREDTPPSWETRAHDSIWAYDVEVRDPTVEFVNSTFSQALHTALYLSFAIDEIEQGSLDPESALTTVAAIDPATAQQSYWRTWLEIMSH